MSGGSDFIPRDEPGAITWSEGGFLGHQSPWSVEELLARPSAEWSGVASFRQTDPFGPGESLRDVSKRRRPRTLSGVFNWPTHSREGNWQTDLWSSLMSSWCHELDREEYRSVLGYLNQPELHANHGRSVVEFLRAFIKTEAVASAPELLSLSNRIARAVGLHRGQIDLFLALHGWWAQAINVWRANWHSTGAKVSLLGASSENLLRNKWVKNIALPFLTLLPMQRWRERWARRFLPAVLLFCWKCTSSGPLLPLFGRADDRSAYQAVWDGFLASKKTTRLAELLKDAFLEAIPRLESICRVKSAEATCPRLHVDAGIHCPDPTEILNDWSPTFFANTAEEDKVLFGHNLGSQIEGMEDAQQRELWDRWLGRYLENRLQGVPAPLLPGEVVAILGWLPHFKSLFPDAVELAVKLPPQLDHSSTLYPVKEGTLWETYPESSLVGLFGQMAHFEGKELIDKLLD